MKRELSYLVFLLCLVLPQITMSQITITQLGDTLIAEPFGEVRYTLDGSRPGSSSLLSMGPIVINQPTQNELLNRLPEFIVTDSSWLFTRVLQEGQDYHTTEPDPLNVKKRTIFRACIECGTRNEQSAIRTIGDYQQDGWEIQIIFDNPELMFASDSGLYVAGPGVLLEDSTGTYSFYLANFSIGNQERVVGFVNPSFDTIVPYHHLMNGVSCTTLFFKDGLLAHESTGLIRVNGGISTSKPLKAFKIKLDNPSNEIPFLETGNLYLRRPSTHGMSDLLANTFMVRLEPMIPKIAKYADQGHVMIHGGTHLESFGRYHLYSSGDKKFAREHLGFGSDVKSFDVIEPGGEAGFLMADNWDTVGVMITARGIRDTAFLFSQPYSYVDSLVNDRAWIAFLFQIGLFRGIDVLNNNMKFFAENSVNLTPVIKDGDGLFDPYYYVNGNSYSNLDYNHLEAAVMGYPGLSYGSNRDNIPYWIFRALMYFPGEANRNQNLMIDYLETAFQQDEIDFIADSLATNWLGLLDEYAEIEDINAVDMNWIPQLFDRNIEFVADMRQAFLKDFINLFHLGYDTTDIFNINVVLDEGLMTDCSNAGFVEINSMKFTESGSRLHIRDYAVQVHATALPGFYFSYWEEYPDSLASFTLINNVAQNITLTPIFTEVEDVCSEQGFLVVNELLPWSTGGSEDKIEIYNPTPGQVSLIGMCLTDAADEPCKWRFPESVGWVIEPDSFIVVTENDINFSLSKNGERCSLSFFDETLVSEIVYGALPSSDLTVGLCNGQVQFMTPSLGSSNQCALGVQDYAAPFELGPVTYFDVSGRVVLELQKNVPLYQLNLIPGAYVKRYSNGLGESVIVQP